MKDNELLDKLKRNLGSIFWVLVVVFMWVSHSKGWLYNTAEMEASDGWTVPLLYLLTAVSFFGVFLIWYQKKK